MKIVVLNFQSLELFHTRHSKAEMRIRNICTGGSWHPDFVVSSPNIYNTFLRFFFLPYFCKWIIIITICLHFNCTFNRIPRSHIKSLLFNLIQLHYTIQFLWIPSHTGIHKNKFVDKLAKSTSNFIYSPSTLLPYSNFILFIKRYISNLWSIYWNN